MDETARQRARASLRRHAPQLTHLPLRVLGHGLDNTAFILGDLVVRVSGQRSVLREARLLRVVAAHVSLPVPTTCFVDEEAGVLAYRLLPGLSLLGREPGRSAAHQLGRFLRELHDVDPVEVAGIVPAQAADPHEWLDDLVGPESLLAELRGNIPPPAPQRALIHADLGAEHLLELNGTLTGVIDWSDVAISDPALDFARLYRDFGTTFLSAALTAYGGLDDPDASMARITFFARCAALEDLAYGQECGHVEYTHAAEQALTWLFPRSS